MYFRGFPFMKFAHYDVWWNGYAQQNSQAGAPSFRNVHAVTTLGLYCYTNTIGYKHSGDYWPRNAWISLP